MKKLNWAHLTLLGLVLTAILGITAAIVAIKNESEPSTIHVNVPATVQAPAVVSGVVTNTHPCDPANWAMQCSLQAPNRGLGPSLPPPTAAKVVAYGVDFAWGGPSVQALNAAGKAFGASYWSHDLTKNWTTQLVGAYHRAHKGTVGVYESGQFRATEGPIAAAQDASTATAQARQVGNTKDTIVFAVDCDCSGPSIFPYFRELHRELGDREAAYGGYNQIHYLFYHSPRVVGFHNWQTYAWSGGAWLPAKVAPLEQYLNDVRVGGIDTDLDRAIRPDYAQWPSPAGARPYAVLDRTVRTFIRPAPSPVWGAPRVVKAREYQTVVTWYGHHCRLPVQRVVCRTSLEHLTLLEGRVVFVAHHKGAGLHQEARPPRWGQAHLGARHLILDKARRGR